MVGLVLSRSSMGRDHPRAGPRRPLAEPPLVEDRDRDPLTGQAIGDREPDHAAADHHHVGGLHRPSPFDFFQTSSAIR